MTHSQEVFPAGPQCPAAASESRREEEENGGNAVDRPAEITPAQLRCLIPQGAVHEGCEYVVVTPGLCLGSGSTKTFVRFLLGAPAFRLYSAHARAFLPELQGFEKDRSLEDEYAPVNAHVPALVYLTKRNFEALIASGNWGLPALLMETALDHEYAAVAANFPGNFGRVLCSGGEAEVIALLCRERSPAITNCVVSEVISYATTTPLAIPQLRVTSMGFYVWICKNMILWLQADVARSLSILYATDGESDPYSPFYVDAYSAFLLWQTTRTVAIPSPPPMAPVLPPDVPTAPPPRLLKTRTWLRFRGPPKRRADRCGA